MNYDVLVLGSGPAGFYAALTCSRGGLKTALIENDIMGGTGLATGCLPVKLILDKIRSINSAKSIEGLEDINFFDTYSSILKGMAGHITDVSSLENSRLEESGVDLYHSPGSFKDKNTYVINSFELIFKKVIIATGTEPSSPGFCDFSKRIISHKEAVTLETVPGKMIIVGGDVEGIEFASIFGHMGIEVQIIEQLSEILPGYDRDLVDPVKQNLLENRVEFICNRKVSSIEELGKQVIVHCGSEIFEADMVLITGFRKPSIPHGLEALGVDCSSGYINVNESYETSIPGIYAIGDINGLLPMAGAAIQQAVQLSDFLLKRVTIEQDYSILPRAVFTIPIICGAGIQEKELVDLEGDYSVKIFSLEKNWRHLNSKNKNEFVKVIIDSRNIVKGIWFVGEKADTYGSASGLIIKNNITIESLRRDLYIHPTIFESIFEAGLL